MFQKFSSSHFYKSFEGHLNNQNKRQEKVAKVTVKLSYTDTPDVESSGSSFFVNRGFLNIKS